MTLTEYQTKICQAPDALSAPLAGDVTNGIYWFYQTTRDRALYVGSSVNVERRLSKHLWQLKTGKHPNQRLQHTWNKYGSGDIQYAILEKCDKSVLAEREQFWMDAMPSWPTCNIGIAAKHPMLGRSPSSITRKNISVALQGHTVDSETRNKLSAAQRGRRYGLETRQRVGRSRLGHVVSEEARKKNSLAPGHRSEETRKKLSLAGMGHIVSEETRQKLRDANLGRKASDETCRKMSSAHRGCVMSEKARQNIREAQRRRRAKEKNS